MKNTIHIILYSIAILLVMNCTAQNLSTLPLFNISDLSYEGAFRLPDADFGISSMNYSEGPIAYNKANQSLFIVGHTFEQAIAEFTVPSLSTSTLLTDLTIASNPIQTFVTVLNETSNSNPDSLDRIGGMAVLDINGVQKLMLNAYEYYDAPGDNTYSTLIVEDINDLSNSAKTGYYNYQALAGHSSGWISHIPIEWQDTIGANYLTGQSSGLPIISRLSVGPSAYAFNTFAIEDTASTIPTTEMLDFSLYEPLREDLYNDSLDNDVWTHLSRVTYGFIVPGTRTYFTVGYSGGHNSGVCYKCEQNNGIECPGFCAVDTSDYYHYYWLWDMNDLMAVKNGVLLPYDVEPYDYGEFSTAFENDYKQIGGGSFDDESGNLYLSIQRIDEEQGYFTNPPVIVVYNTNSISATDVYLTKDDISLYPNPTEDLFEIRGLIPLYTIEILDVNGNVHQTFTSTGSTLQIDINTLPSGLYFISIYNNQNTLVALKKILKGI